MGKTNNNNINDDGLNAIQTQTLEDFANSLCCSACKSSKSSNNTIIEVCVCVCICARVCMFFSALSSTLFPRATVFSLCLLLSYLSLSHLSLDEHRYTDGRTIRESIF
jgi:hypothetical protein